MSSFKYYINFMDQVGLLGWVCEQTQLSLNAPTPLQTITARLFKSNNNFLLCILHGILGGGEGGLGYKCELVEIHNEHIGLFPFLPVFNHVTYKLYELGLAGATIPKAMLEII